MCGSPAGRTHKSLGPDIFDSKNHSNVLKVDATSVANPVVQFTLPEHRLYEEKLPLLTLHFLLQHTMFFVLVLSREWMAMGHWENGNIMNR